MCVQSGRDSMDQVSVTAASGLQSRMEALDLVANNLANTTTGGFKLDREFYSLFTAAENEDDEASTKLPPDPETVDGFQPGRVDTDGQLTRLGAFGQGIFRGERSFGPDVHAQRIVQAVAAGRVDHH